MAKRDEVARKYWVGVASLEHVRAAVQGGYCQLSHGKKAPVRRLKEGDLLVFYSPKESMKGDTAVQAFSAIGHVLDDEPYQIEQAPGFKPFRRKVRYSKTAHAPIRPLLEDLTFTKGRTNWSFAFRRGAFEIDEQDFLKIAEAMKL